MPRNLHDLVQIRILTCVERGETRRRRDAEVNRESLLEAALRALLDDPDAGLDAVASAARLSRRTVYGHFASREELVAALADRAGEHVAAVVGRVRAGTSPGEHPLTTLARLEISLWRTIERYRLLGSLATRREQQARVRRHTGELQDLRTRLVEAGRLRGDLTEALPVPVVVRLVGAVPITVFDAVVDGALLAGEAARADALTALAVAGAAPNVAVHHVDAVLAGTPLAAQELS
jgi:AcrR family transcriptional regulator